MREMRKAAVAFVAAAALTLSVTPCAMGTTATQNNENIQAISTMAAAPDGSRKNPYDIKKGVKLKDSIGTTYLKLQAVYKGSSATKKARALTKKKNRSYLSYLSYQLKKKAADSSSCSRCTSRQLTASRSTACTGVLTRSTVSASTTRR